MRPGAVVMLGSAILAAGVVIVIVGASGRWWPLLPITGPNRQLHPDDNNERQQRRSGTEALAAAEAGTEGPVR